MAVCRQIGNGDKGHSVTPLPFRGGGVILAVLLPPVFSVFFFLVFASFFYLFFALVFASFFASSRHLLYLYYDSRFAPFMAVWGHSGYRVFTLSVIFYIICCCFISFYSFCSSKKVPFLEGFFSLFSCSSSLRFFSYSCLLQINSGVGYPSFTVFVLWYSSRL